MLFKSSIDVTSYLFSFSFSLWKASVYRQANLAYYNNKPQFNDQEIWSRSVKFALTVKQYHFPLFYWDKKIMLERIQQDVDKKVYFSIEISKLEQMRGAGII